MDPIVELVNRSNQRGGRMLSVVDLLAAHTLSRDQAAWLLARIAGGASFLVGARPGGAGKTAVQGALLAMLPAGETVRLAVRGSGWEASRPGECVVAYEIGQGPWEAYAWGRDVVRMAALGRAGCRLVANLHADTLDDARRQIAGQCGAGEAGLAAFGTFVPIRTSGRGEAMSRVVGRILWHDGTAWRPHDPAAQAHGPGVEAAGAFLDRCLSDGTRTIEAVRAAWLAQPTTPGGIAC